MNRFVLAALAGTVLAGCAAAPDRPVPAPVVTAPAAWQAPPPAAAAGDAVWSRFDDPLLLSLVDAAQAASADVSAAANRIAQARAARVAAAAALGPQAGATASAVHGRTDPTSPIGTRLSAGVEASWELDLFGGNRAGRDAAQARVEGAQATREAVRLAVAAETATTYVALRACEAQREVARIDSASRAETARLTEASAQAGFRAPADAALARASAAQGRAQLTQQAAACEQLLKSLVALSAIEEPALRQRLDAATARLPAGALPTVATLPAALLQQRPDLAAAARAVAAAAADHTQRDAARWPQVSLSGSVGGMRIRTSDVSFSATTFSIGPLAVSLPLFDGGRRAADVEAARAAYDDAVVQLQAALRNAVREVEDALVRLQATATRADDARLAAENFEASLRATEARWKGGVASLFELEDARRSAAAARATLIELDRERLVAGIDLIRALGGGWSQDRLAGL
jgi:outer membrane protein, multidrug efflux system